MDTAMPPSQPAATSSEDKTVAIVSYLTVLGFIIALVMHGSKKTEIGAFHLRQSLGLMLTGIVGWIALVILGVVLAFIPVIGWILMILLWFTFGIGVFVLFVMGLIGAINGQMKPVPVLGELFQKWFGSAFK